MNIMKVDNLAEHLNDINKAGNIKFTSEQEHFTISRHRHKRNCRSVPVVHLLHENTHTDQHLSFLSHHPLHHNLEIFRTLLDRKEVIISDEEDNKEEEHMNISSKTSAPRQIPYHDKSTPVPRHLMFCGHVQTCNALTSFVIV